MKAPDLEVGRCYRTVGDIVFVVVRGDVREVGKAWRVLVLDVPDGVVSPSPRRGQVFDLNCESGYHHNAVPL